MIAAIEAVQRKPPAKGRKIAKGDRTRPGYQLRSRIIGKEACMICH
jgi:hypothetical protein